MALYEKKLSSINEAKYWVEITPHPIFNYRRALHVFEQINGGTKILIDGTIYAIDANGNNIDTDLAPPKAFVIKCTKNSEPWVFENTGVKNDNIIRDSEGNWGGEFIDVPVDSVVDGETVTTITKKWVMPEGTITRFEFLRTRFPFIPKRDSNNNIIPYTVGMDYVDDMEIMFIKNADLDGEL